MRFVGLGDSLTEGVGDPVPGLAGFSGKLDGWIQHLAEAISATGVPVSVDNYARAGARLQHVIADQLPRLRTLKDQQCQQSIESSPDIISCFIGVNDLWDANLDLDAFSHQYRQLFSELSTIAPTVITASIHDVFAPYRVKAPLRDKLNANIASMNKVIREVVAAHNLVLIDFANKSEMFQPNVLAIDRLHPNRYGHRLIAGEVLGQLQALGQFVAATTPSAQPVRRGVADAAHIAWVGGYVKRNWKSWRSETERADNAPKFDGSQSAIVSRSET